MSKKLSAGALVLILVSIAPAIAGDDAAESVLDGWLARQATIRTWSADLVQIRKLVSLTRSLESPGRVWFAQPARFRWQLGEPPRTIAVRSGDELLVIYPRLGQIERFAYSEAMDPAARQALALLEAGFPADREQFESQYRLVSTARAGESWVLELQPAAEAARRLIERVRIQLAATDYGLQATELEFPDGSIMRNEFRETVTNPELDPELFEFAIDPAFTVVDPLAGG